MGASVKPKYPPPLHLEPSRAEKKAHGHVGSSGARAHPQRFCIIGSLDPVFQIRKLKNTKKGKPRNPKKATLRKSLFQKLLRTYDRMPTGTRLMCYTSRPSVPFIYILYPLERFPIETTEQPAPSPLRGGGSTTTKKGLGGPLRWRGGVRGAPP